MAQVTPYREVIVESFKPARTSGLHGEVHVRPLPGQGLPVNMFVACSKLLSTNYPVGTKFKIRARVTDRQGGGKYLYSNYTWPVEEVSAASAEAFIRSQAGLGG